MVQPWGGHQLCAVSTVSADAGRNGRPLRAAAAALVRGAVTAEVGTSEVALVIKI